MPAIAGALPSRRLDNFAKGRELEGQPAIGVEGKRGAIEDELVLAADLVDIDQRDAALGHAGDRDVETHLVLVTGVRRSVGHDHQLGARLAEAFHYVFVVTPFGPNVLTDRKADAHASEIDGTGRRPGREQPPFVKHAVIREVHLQPHGGNDAAVEQAICVVELAAIEPGRPDQQRRTAAGCFPRKLLDLGAASRLKGRLEHEVLGRIARHKKFRQR